MRLFSVVRLFSLMFGVMHAAIESPTAQETHPRLFLDSLRLSELRTLVQTPGTHHGEAFSAMMDRVENERHFAPEFSDPINYQRNSLAREASLLYLLTGDTKWSDMAYQNLIDIYKDRSDRLLRIPDEGYALGRAMTGMGFAIAYDFCYHGWSESQRQSIRALIRKALNEWTELEYPVLTGNHVWEPYHSNWVAVARSAEIVMMLALHEETDSTTGLYQIDRTKEGLPNSLPLPANLTRANRFTFLKLLLRSHLEHAYGPLGVMGEGNYYCSFAGSFLQAARLALLSVGDDSLEDEFQKHRWHEWVMYVGGFGPDMLTLSNGVGGNSGLADGWYSLLMGTVPEAELPYFKYWYDHHIGIESRAPIDHRFDARRAGSLWALVYYPQDVQSRNPETILKPMTYDLVRGLFLFRNHWRSEDDLQVSFNADAGWEENVWNQPEAFQLGLIGGGTRYTKAPLGNYEPDALSSLLVDGQSFIEAPISEEPSDTGAIAHAEVFPHGGYAIADGAQKYARLGLQSAYRHFMVDFSHGPAVISVLDELRSTKDRVYTWQLNVPTEEELGPREITAGTESGRSTFLMKGKDSGYLKGWVMTEGAEVKPGRRFHIDVMAKDAEIWVVMVLGRGEPPVAEISGIGLASRFQSGDIDVSFEASTRRLQSQPSASISRKFRPGTLRDMPRGYITPLFGKQDKAFDAIGRLR